MRRAYWPSLVVGLVVVVIAAACAPGSTAATPVPTPPPDTAAQAPGTIGASAVVEPSQQSSLAFLLAAPVKQVYAKAGDQVSAGQPLIMLDTPDLGYAVTAAEAELSSAQANAALQRMGRKKWNGNEWVFVSTPPEWKKQADARVMQAQAALDAAQANLAQATLVAPFDGTIVSVDVVPGETVLPQKAVLVIADLTHLQVTSTDLSEREIAAVQVGQPTDVHLKAFAQDLTGKVVAIAPMAQINNGDTVFKVTVRLDQQPNGLLWGMTGDLSIQAGK